MADVYIHEKLLWLHIKDNNEDCSLSQNLNNITIKDIIYWIAES